MSEATGHSPRAEERPTPGSNRTGRKRRPPLTKEQRIILQDEALALRVKSETFGTIARLLSDPRFLAAKGFPEPIVISRSTAHELVKSALRVHERNIEGTREALRILQIMQAQEIMRALWPKKNEPRVADACGRQMERIAKLRGLDAPTQVKHSGEVATTPALPLSLLTDEELDLYEKLSASVAARKKAAAEEKAANAGAAPVDDEDERSAAEEEGADDA